ncbi:restriction endonuclease subunit S [Helicobacter pylori]
MDALTTPSNWQKVRLGDICEFGNGGAYETLIVENGDFKLISLNSIDIDGNLKNTMKRVNFYDNSLKQDDIVMVLSDVAHGDFLGLCAVIPSNDYVLNQRMGRLRIRNDCINILFLRLYINANQKYFKMQGQGSSQLNLSKKAIEDFEIPLPPLNEQIAIANILSALDHYLYTLDALILKKESVKKALSFELLSQRKRLKGFNQNWQKVRLGDICYLKNGFSFKSDLFKNMGIPIIRISNISSVDNCINTNDLVFYDPILIDNDYILKQGDLILAMSGATTGKSCLYNLNKIAYLNQRVGVFRAKTSFCYDFLVQFVFSELFTSRLKLILTAGAQPNISSFDIEDFEILLPPLNEQIAIANILSALDSEIISLKNKKRQFENIKKALNHDLMSAKIRVLKK